MIFTWNIPSVSRENFYTLAWTTLQFGEASPESGGKSSHLKSNILVSGGIRGEIRMFHPENKVSTWKRLFLGISHIHIPQYPVIINSISFTYFYRYASMSGDQSIKKE